MIKFIEILDWLNKWATPTCSALAGMFGLAWEKDFAGIVLSEFPARTGLHEILSNTIPWAFLIFFVAAGIFSSFRIFTQKTIKSLSIELQKEHQNADLVANNVEALVTGLLLQLSSRLGFTRGEPTRLTIYVHNGNGGFISFGRHCPDPTYAGKGRTLLSANAGCIAKAWANDWCYEGDLAYKDARRKYQITREAYETMRMKSKFYAVKRIDSNTSQPLAVVVLESINPNRFAENQVKSVLDGEEAYLASTIQCLKPHIPDPGDAKRRRF